MPLPLSASRRSGLRLPLLLFVSALCVLPAFVRAQRLFFSTYMHSTSNTQLVEVYNPGCFPADLSEFTVRVAPYSDHATGAEWGSALALGTNTLDARSHVTLCRTSLGSSCTQTNAFLNFTGADAVGLFHNNVLIDIIGSTSGMVAPACTNCVDLRANTGAPWIVAGVLNATRGHTLERRVRVSEGSVDFFHPKAQWVGHNESSEWIVSTTPAFGAPANLGQFQCTSCTCPVGIIGILRATCGTLGKSVTLASGSASSVQIDCPLDCLARTARPVVGSGIASVVGSSNRYAETSPVCLAAIHAGVLAYNRDAFPAAADMTSTVAAIVAPLCTGSGTSSLPAYSGGDSTLFPASNRMNGRPYLSFKPLAWGTAYTGLNVTCIASVAGPSTLAGFSLSILNTTVCDATNCGGPHRGYCNQNTGHCLCIAPWNLNDVCSRASCPYTSCNNGFCDTTTGKCSCNMPDWTGDECLTRTCFDACSGRGECDRVTGECTCHAPYFGLSCEKRLCLNNCTGSNGVCNYATGRCSCAERYAGEDCSLHTCAEGCSAFGTCDYSTGQCRCIGSLPEGSPVPAQCVRDACPSTSATLACSGHGTCNYESRMCTCSAGWRGLDCSVVGGCIMSTSGPRRACLVGQRQARIM